MRESIELNGVIAGCIDAGYTCWPVPSAFVRYSIYAAIALIEVVVLFSWSLRVERQMRNRHYAPGMAVNENIRSSDHLVIRVPKLDLENLQTVATDDQMTR